MGFMKARLDPATTPEQKMAHFQNALGRALRVSKDELNRRLQEDEKHRRRLKDKPGPKPSS